MTRQRNFKAMNWAIAWTLLAVILWVWSLFLPAQPLWPWITTLVGSTLCVIPAQYYINRI